MKLDWTRKYLQYILCSLYVPYMLKLASNILRLLCYIVLIVHHIQHAKQKMISPWRWHLHTALLTVLALFILDVQAWQIHFLSLWLLKNKKYGEILSISLWHHSSAVLFTANSVGHNASLVLCPTGKWSDFIWKLHFRDASVALFHEIKWMCEVFIWE